MRNESSENFLLSFGVGAAAGIIAALLLTPLLSGGARGAAEESGEGGALEVPPARAAGDEPPRGWKAYFFSVVERFIIAIRAGSEEMRRVREEWAAKGG